MSEEKVPSKEQLAKRNSSKDQHHENREQKNTSFEKIPAKEQLAKRNSSKDQHPAEGSDPAMKNPEELHTNKSPTEVGDVTSSLSVTRKASKSIRQKRRSRISQDHTSSVTNLASISSPSNASVKEPRSRRLSKMEPQFLSFNTSKRPSFRRSLTPSMGIPVKSGPKIANTYRLAPNPKEKFLPRPAIKIMNSVLQINLEGEQYHSLNDPAKICKSISETIKDKVKESKLFSQRYRYICMVSLGQNANQGFTSASRCLWQDAYDSFAEVKYNRGDLFCVAVLYAVYYE